MSYGHAERNLALIRQLEAETRQLLESLNQPPAEQSARPQTARMALPLPRMPAEDANIQLELRTSEIVEFQVMPTIPGRGR